ncbi:MAG TPA: SPOR domain-containing protein [Candidatus Binataceae bacterium]|nr:SPOR domain-containing protein [Candidatus Binataceae bacterium]
MRFEIGPGGGFVILVGLLGLSAAVFFLGMISGREMAQSEQGQSQLASVYPMPAGASSIPAAAPASRADVPVAPPVAPVAAATPKPPARAAVASVTMPPAVLPKPPLTNKAPPRPTLASVPPKRPSAPAAEESGTDTAAPSDESDTGAGESAASAPPPSTGTHHGYNIVIDAAMDRAAANRMASRLLGLGYTSHIVPGQINGQTWYRVQVGPYPTSDEARAAQAQLRAAYSARYINRAGAASTGTAGAAASAGAASAGSTDTDASDSGAADSGSDDSGGGNSAPSD